MVWKSKLTRRSKDKKSRREDSSNRCASSPSSSNLKSCLKHSSDAQSASSSFDSSSNRRSVTESLGSSHSYGDLSRSNHGSAGSYSQSRGSSYTSSMRSPIHKIVRFDHIEIREYERTVGDNPSVSMGPPVTIDWKYHKSSKSNLEEYESFRGPRREQLELILTRNERESLLLEWGVPTYKIAGGTRLALKSKNQRKQTIINAGKIARIEEALEAASKRLKGAFSSKGANTIETIPETEVFDKAGTVQTTNMTLDSEKQTRDFQSPLNPPPSRVVSVEPESDINFDKLGMNVTISRVVSDAPEGALMATCSAAGEDSESIDDNYTLGATTFGNKSATPSILEMEKFYRELEMEMFGEEASLPCMVGQTLEVSIDDLSEGGDGDDITIATAFRSISKFEVTEPPSQEGDEENFSEDPASQHYSGPHAVEPNWRFQNDRWQNYCYHEREYYQNSNANSAAAYSVSNAYNHGQRNQEFKIQNNFDSERSRSGSFESLLGQKSMQTYESSYTQFGDVQEQYPLFSAPQNQMVSWNSPLPDRWNSTYNIMPSRHHVYRSNGQSYFDGPRISHNPLHGHLSPNQWMGECDSRTRSYVNAAVTIVEESCQGVPS